MQDGQSAIYQQLNIKGQGHTFVIFKEKGLLGYIDVSAEPLEFDPNGALAEIIIPDIISPNTHVGLMELLY